MNKTTEDGFSLISHKIFCDGHVYWLKEFCDRAGACRHSEIYDISGNEIKHPVLEYKLREIIDEFYAQNGCNFFD